MSRIDEARRRAAAAAGSAAPVADAPMADADPTLEIDRFGRESADPAAMIDRFVSEPPRRREPEPVAREAAPAAVTPPPRIEPAVTRKVEVPAAAAPPAPRPLLEHIDESMAEKVVADERLGSLPREQYRRLAAVLLDLQTNRDVSVLMVASAMPAEGKTLTATNLALTLSESYQAKVLLIDADLRRPALHDVFRLNAGYGLTEGLDTSATGSLVVRQITPRLSVLPAGRPSTDPMAALTSPRMRQLITEARQSYAWVILDTPPLMLLPDAHLLSGLVDTAVLVVRANTTPHNLVQRSIDTIGRQRIVGVILNRAEASHQPTYVDYHAYPPDGQPRGTGQL